MGLEKISEYKKKLGWTNEILAEKSGVPKGTLSKITAGITKDPQLATLKKIADALGCQVEDFVDHDPDSPFCRLQGVQQSFDDVLSEEQEELRTGSISGITKPYPGNFINKSAAFSRAQSGLYDVSMQETQDLLLISTLMGSPEVKLLVEAARRLSKEDILAVVDIMNRIGREN